MNIGFNCGLCARPANNPVIETSCGANFCESCIGVWRLSNAHCPICVRPLNAIPNLGLRAMAASVQAASIASLPREELYQFKCVECNKQIQLPKSAFQETQAQRYSNSHGSDSGYYWTDIVKYQCPDCKIHTDFTGTLQQRINQKAIKVVTQQVQAPVSAPPAPAAQPASQEKLFRIGHSPTGVHLKAELRGDITDLEISQLVRIRPEEIVWSGFSTQNAIKVLKALQQAGIRPHTFTISHWDFFSPIEAVKEYEELLNKWRNP